MRARLARAWRLLHDALSRAVGAPDYAAYLEHQRAHHPERAPLGHAEFFRQRQAARYGSDGPPRCC